MTDPITQQAAALASLGMVSRTASGYTVQGMGFAAPTYRVQGGSCSCNVPACVHLSAVARAEELGTVTDTPESAEGKGEPRRAMSEFATPPQLRMIRVRAAAKGVDAESLSRRLFGRKPEALTRREAGMLVEELCR